MSPTFLLLALMTIFVGLAFVRPVDHDESQYIAAAVLTSHGLRPYLDYAYLQTPLQPFLFAPIAWLAGVWTWPALRIVNAVLGAVAVAGVYSGVTAVGATDRQARAVAGLFATCDILLFSVGVARNDALPVACFAWAVAMIAAGGGERRRTLGIGALLTLAAAAKISYGLPAGAFGAWTLINRDRRPLALLMGAAPVLAFVAATFLLAPAAFLFGTIEFPAFAPTQFYADQPWKLSIGAKLIDTLKFLTLGAGLPALVIVIRDSIRRPEAIDVLLAASLVAALLPSPTWRQYLLPVLPPLFVRLAMAWRFQPPSPRQSSTLAVFAGAGVASAATAILTPGALHLLPALQQAVETRRVMDEYGVTGPVATLSPQFLPTTGRLPDKRFATGPFYFRSRGLLAPERERRFHLFSCAADPLVASAALIGGENAATSGDARVDAAFAYSFGGTAVPVPNSGWTLLIKHDARGACP